MNSLCTTRGSRISLSLDRIPSIRLPETSSFRIWLDIHLISDIRMARILGRERHMAIYSAMLSRASACKALSPDLDQIFRNSFACLLIQRRTLSSQHLSFLTLYDGYTYIWSRSGIYLPGSTCNDGTRSSCDVPCPTPHIFDAVME